jgi:hypothetical protein
LVGDLSELGPRRRGAPFLRVAEREIEERPGLRVETSLSASFAQASVVFPSARSCCPARNSTSAKAEFRSLRSSPRADVVVTSRASRVGTAMTTRAKESEVAALSPIPRLDAQSSAHTFATVSTVAFIAAAAGLGVGTYLVLSSGSSSPKRAMRIGPVAMSGGGLLRIDGSF